MRGPARGAWRGSLPAAVAAAAALIAPSAAQADFDCGAYISRCPVQIDNSGRAWFDSPEKLTEDALGDGTIKHGVFQVYERAGHTTTLLKGPGGEPFPYDAAHHSTAFLTGVSADGERVYISTTASLTPDDRDDPAAEGSSDGYVLQDGAYTLLTTGPLDESPGGPFVNAPSVVWASDDGSHVYFVTGRRMTTEDKDDATDVYERSDGTTRLVSTGPAEVLPDPNYSERAPEATFVGASPDGSTAYFATSQQLTVDDTEKWTSDIYSWHEGTTRRLTHTVRYPEGPGQPYESFSRLSWGGAAEDGSIFFTASSPQSPDDTDAYDDLYMATPDGTIRRLPVSTPGTTYASASEAFLRAAAVSRDGSRVFFITGRRLVPEDHDDLYDIYLLETATGRVRLVSAAESDNPPKEAELMLTGISSDGKRAYFTTWERLSPEDTDEKVDVYEWNEGRERLVSPASDGRQTYALFDGISPNGRYVAFTTFEDLVPGDEDGKADIYLVDMGPESSAARAAAYAARPGGRLRDPRRRIKLLTAESIPPRMGIAASGTFGAGAARVRLSCPRAETSGPCHGRARLFSADGRRPLASGTFRIKAGRHAEVALDGAGLPRRSGPLRALLRVRGADMLNNAARVHGRVTLRRTG